MGDPGKRAQEMIGEKEKRRDKGSVERKIRER
jgi:hypothetical protein